MDLVKILENFPIDTPLYSIVHGSVYYKGIECDSKYPIICIDKHNSRLSFAEDGKWVESDGECILFPSKDNRNWDDFAKHAFKPFDKVLVRDSINKPWELSFFGYIDKSSGDGEYCTINGYHWYDCIPYEGNEHLLGVIERP